jgi:hypothetical protein
VWERLASPHWQVFRHSGNWKASLRLPERNAQPSYFPRGKYNSLTPTGNVPTSIVDPVSSFYGSIRTA